MVLHDCHKLNSGLNKIIDTIYSMQKLKLNDEKITVKLLGSSCLATIT